jgi:hypothetical protein
LRTLPTQRPAHLPIEHYYRKIRQVQRRGMRVYGLYDAAQVSPDSHTKNRPPRFFPPH